MTDINLEDLADEAFGAVQDAGGDPRGLDEPLRTVAIVYAAQAVLDNGGLAYFLDNDWNGTPTYELFAEAFERIGAHGTAGALREAVERIGLPCPEVDRELRSAHLSRLSEADVEALDARLDDDPIELLRRWVEGQR
ncbi:MAG: DUF4375 domain-containing protein [Planctomycetota bacterium]|nr:DUF4375 domain-containing protein [Planctomycetota bacterium]